MQNRAQKIIKEAGFASAELYPLKEGGSCSQYWRIKTNEKRAILLIVDGKHKDFYPYIEISNFLRRIGVGVPEIYFHDVKSGAIIEEDLGDLTLQDYILNTKSYKIYRQVIDELLLMQIVGGKKLSECKYLSDRVLGYNTFRWETWYFTRYFIEFYCGRRIDNHNELEGEFHRLATHIANEPLYLMHRDFQSKNILIKDGKIRIVDFQGARQGLLAYDVVSLLKDPYVEVDHQLMEELIDYYLYRLKNRHNITTDPVHFKRTILYCGLQRHMQALGAFAFLSAVEHKVQFAQYIPRAVRYIVEALAQIGEFPRLLKIVKEC